MSDLQKSDISTEEWREYDFGGRVYRVTGVTLYWRSGGSTHRVVDDKGVVHCLPVPGQQGCVLRWKSKNPDKPVDF